MADIKEHMEIIGADGVHIGTVDKVEGNRIKLTKKDSGEGSHKGHHCQSALEWDPLSASKRDPFDRRVLMVALAASELAGVAETARARVV